MTALEETRKAAEKYMNRVYNDIKNGVELSHDDLCTLTIGYTEIEQINKGPDVKYTIEIDGETFEIKCTNEERLKGQAVTDEEFDDYFSKIYSDIVAGRTISRLSLVKLCMHDKTIKQVKTGSKITSIIKLNGETFAIDWEKRKEKGSPDIFENQPYKIKVNPISRLIRLIKKWIQQKKMWYKLSRRIPIEIGEVTTNTGKSYGIITTNDIDLWADYGTLFTMYSTMMHELKRYKMDYAYMYNRWTEHYEELTNSELFKGKDYCLRCGEAIRYHFAQKAGIEFTPKYTLSTKAHWIIVPGYDMFIWENNDQEALEDVALEITNMEECFAEYKIAFNKVDAAY